MFPLGNPEVSDRTNHLAREVNIEVIADNFKHLKAYNVCGSSLCKL